MLFVLRILRKPWRSSAWSVQLVLSCCAVFAWAERFSFFRLRLFGDDVDVSPREAPTVIPPNTATKTIEAKFHKAKPERKSGGPNF